MTDDHTARLLRLQDEERENIAHELHDGCAQTLTALSLKLATLQEMDTVTADEGASGLLAEAVTLVEQVSIELRAISRKLHPPSLTQVGLIPAAESYIKDFSRRAGVDVATTFPSFPTRLTAETEIALFRILQEYLTNVHRHSDSAWARVGVAEDDGYIVLTIEDGGSGFPPTDVNRYEIGLLNIRERVRELAGTAEIQSHSSGTSIRIRVPAQWA